MNPYAPPQSSEETSYPLVSRSKVCFASLLAGMASYYVSHFLSGVLGEWKWPSLLMAAAKLYKPITMPIMDLLVTGTPFVLAYCAIALAWSKAVRSSKRSVSLAFGVGWLVPALFVVAYGEFTEPGVFFDQWAKWPHLAVLMFSPLIGVWVGFWLVSRSQSSASEA